MNASGRKFLMAKEFLEKKYGDKIGEIDLGVVVSDCTEFWRKNGL